MQRFVVSVSRGCGHRGTVISKCNMELAHSCLNKGLVSSRLGVHLPLSLRWASSVPPSMSSTQPNSPEEWYNLGSQAWEDGKVEDALEAYRSAGQSADALYNVGACLASLGRLPEAAEAWRASLNADPTRADAHINLANLYAGVLRDPESAQSLYERALELTPEDGQAHYNFGLFLDSQGKLEQAISHYQAARKLDIEQADQPLRNALAKFIGKAATEKKAAS